MGSKFKSKPWAVSEKTSISPYITVLNSSRAHFEQDPRAWKVPTSSLRLQRPVRRSAAQRRPVAPGAYDVQLVPLPFIVIQAPTSTNRERLDIRSLSLRIVEFSSGRIHPSIIWRADFAVIDCTTTRLVKQKQSISSMYPISLRWSQPYVGHWWSIQSEYPDFVTFANVLKDQLIITLRPSVMADYAIPIITDVTYKAFAKGDYLCSSVLYFPEIRKHSLIFQTLLCGLTKTYFC